MFPHLFCIFMILFIVCLGLIAGGCMMDVVNDPLQMLISTGVLERR